jgi:hypothetical protein
MRAIEALLIDNEQALERGSAVLQRVRPKKAARDGADPHGPRRRRIAYPTTYGASRGDGQ